MWAVGGGSTHTAGLVHIMLTSVICVCLSGTRQHHRRETDTLQRVTEPTPVSQGGRAGLLLYYPDLIPAHPV